MSFPDPLARSRYFFFLLIENSRERIWPSGWCCALECQLWFPISLQLIWLRSHKILAIILFMRHGETFFIEVTGHSTRKKVVNMSYYRLVLITGIWLTKDSSTLLPWNKSIAYTRSLVSVKIYDILYIWLKVSDTKLRDLIFFFIVLYIYIWFIFIFVRKYSIPEHI